MHRFVIFVEIYQQIFFEKNRNIRHFFIWENYKYRKTSLKRINCHIREMCIESKNNVSFTHETTFVKSDTTNNFSVLRKIQQEHQYWIEKKEFYAIKTSKSLTIISSKISAIISLLRHQIIESTQSTYNSMRFRRINITIYTNLNQANLK